MIMDYEKKYKDALAKARNIVNSINVGLIGKDSFEAVFPELKESEDERIREELISFVRGVLACHDKPNAERDEKYESWIAWLEKQGGHAKFINGIQVGDKVTRNEDGVLVNLSQLKRVAKKQGEQKPAWNEEDSMHLTNAIYAVEKEWGIESRTSKWLKSFKDKVGCEANCTTTKEWSAGDK